ncbi:MAG: hypothetical protein HC852_09845 [Acaryochloridaceae cyanobacterium RU_4_10]|nr:hypothetical protein [Acaryochloridaceae cyanobacterium RU_4_10]
MKRQSKGTNSSLQQSEDRTTIQETHSSLQHLEDRTTVQYADAAIYSPAERTTVQSLAPMSDYFEDRTTCQNNRSHNSQAALPPVEFKKSDRGQNCSALYCAREGILSYTFRPFQRTVPCCHSKDS